MRKQIHRVLENNTYFRKQWILSENVSCVTAKDIVRVARGYPHVLKIDVEGFDWRVLRGFIDPSVPTKHLPLLVLYEEKIARQYPVASTALRNR